MYYFSFQEETSGDGLGRNTDSLSGQVPAHQQTDSTQEGQGESIQSPFQGHMADIGDRRWLTRALSNKLGDSGQGEQFSDARDVGTLSAAHPWLKRAKSTSETDIGQDRETTHTKRQDLDKNSHNSQVGRQLPQQAANQKLDNPYILPNQPETQQANFHHNFHKACVPSDLPYSPNNVQGQHFNNQHDNNAFGLNQNMYSNYPGSSDPHHIDGNDLSHQHAVGAMSDPYDYQPSNQVEQIYPADINIRQGHNNFQGIQDNAESRTFQQNLDSGNVHPNVDSGDFHPNANSRNIQANFQARDFNPTSDFASHNVHLDSHKGLNQPQSLGRTTQNGNFDSQQGPDLISQQRPFGGQDYESSNMVTGESGFYTAQRHFDPHMFNTTYAQQGKDQYAAEHFQGRKYFWLIK